MPAWKINQLRQESSTWKRLLYFIMEETIILKIRLSEIVKEVQNPALTEAAENYQDRLIKMDEMISFLRSETARLDKALTSESLGNALQKKEVIDQILLLRKNMKVAEEQFSRLRQDFYSCFSEYIQA